MNKVPSKLKFIILTLLSRGYDIDITFSQQKHDIKTINLSCANRLIDINEFYAKLKANPNYSETTLEEAMGWVDKNPTPSLRESG